MVLPSASGGRAVQWTSYDWAKASVLGYVYGLDDLVWRSFAWAARKPLVMRGMPPLVTMRVDDGLGGGSNYPGFGYVSTANKYGLKPFVSFFLDQVSDADARAMKGFVDGGNMTASVHARSDAQFFYFDHGNCQNLPDDTITRNFNDANTFFAKYGITTSKVVVGHYYELGSNVFSNLANWGVQFIATVTAPGTGYGCSPDYLAGPYRLYETPGGNGATYPVTFADWLTVPGHPELDRRFFNSITEIRDVDGYEWRPDNDVNGTVYRGYTQVKRALDSMVLATLFTHEYYIAATTPQNWDASLARISQQLAAYEPMYVTYDTAAQYTRAMATSRLATATYDDTTYQLNVTWTGSSDMATKFYVFWDDGSGIPQRSMLDAPAFSSGYSLATTFHPTPTPTSTPTATATPQTCPCSIWPASATPSVADQPDGGSVELGVKFRSDGSGSISAIRFYKGPTNLGPHTVSLWSATGQLLGQATSSNETTSGWQQVPFASPVPIAANTVYVASYHASVGHYADDQNAFTSLGVDRPPLHAPSSPAAGGNGVYAYGSAVTFPTETYLASNYWVDVVFNQGGLPAGTVSATPTPTPTATNTPRRTRTPRP